MRRRHRGAAHGCASPALLMLRIAAAPTPTGHRAHSARTRAYGVHARSLATFPHVCLPSLRYLRAVRPFHLFTSPCAQALTTAPSTWTWLDFGASGRRYGCSTARLVGAGDLAVLRARGRGDGARPGAQRALDASAPKCKKIAQMIKNTIFLALCGMI